MANSQKRPSQQDSNQVMQGAFNDVDASLSTNGFLVGKVGRKVDVTIATTNVADDTEQYEFSEDGVSLYTIECIYTDGTRETLLSAERTA
jgi:hypothetical protein